VKNLGCERRIDLTSRGAHTRCSESLRVMSSKPPRSAW
jgi:hypothetical protein